MKAKERFQVETVSAFLHLDGGVLYLGQARGFGSRRRATPWASFVNRNSGRNCACSIPARQRRTTSQAKANS